MIQGLNGYKTASWGSSSSAKAYRAMQRGLIKQGKWADAAEMDVKDIKKKFGNKYDSGIKKTLDKAEFDGLISKANKTKIKKKCGGK